MKERSQVVTALIPLPLTYNPDARGHRRPIGMEKYRKTMEEIAKRFGGGILWRFPRRSRPRGYWWDHGYLSKDELAVVEVDIPDTEGSRLWLKRYAETVLLERFAQVAIYVKVLREVEAEVIVCRKQNQT